MLPMILAAKTAAQATQMAATAATGIGDGCALRRGVAMDQTAASGIVAAGARNTAQTTVSIQHIHNWC